jgi:hypothetical protein
MEIIVDAYDEVERAMGWYYYLQDKLNFPFLARCTAKRAVSPIKVGTTVEVVDMAPEEECGKEIFVMVQWQDEELAIPLAQLAFKEGDDETRQAVEDWHYWVERGYCF